MTLLMPPSRRTLTCPSENTTIRLCLNNLFFLASGLMHGPNNHLFKYFGKTKTRKEAGLHCKSDGGLLNIILLRNGGDQDWYSDFSLASIGLVSLLIITKH